MSLNNIVKSGDSVRYLILLFALVLSFPSYATNIFSCNITKNGKKLTLVDKSGVLEYTYGKQGSKPDLLLMKPGKEIEHSAWNGVGRAHTYSVTFTNGVYRYTVFTSIDTIKQERTDGVVVEQNSKFLTELDCKEGTVAGDLESYVGSLDGGDSAGAGQSTQTALQADEGDYPTDSLDVTVRSYLYGGQIPYTMVELRALVDHITIERVTMNNGRCLAYTPNQVTTPTRRSFPATLRMGQKIGLIMPDCQTDAVVNMDVVTDRNMTLHYGK